MNDRLWENPFIAPKPPAVWHGEFTEQFAEYDEAGLLVEIPPKYFLWMYIDGAKIKIPTTKHAIHAMIEVMQAVQKGLNMPTDSEIC